MGMSQKEMRDLGLDVEWIANVGWTGPDWQKATEIEKNMVHARIRMSRFHGYIDQGALNCNLIKDCGDIIVLTPYQWRKFAQKDCSHSCACGGSEIVMPDGRVFGKSGPWDYSLSLS